jgi:hypothetical protein
MVERLIESGEKIITDTSWNYLLHTVLLGLRWARRNIALQKIVGALNIISGALYFVK